MKKIISIIAIILLPAALFAQADHQNLYGPLNIKDQSLLTEHSRPALISIVPEENDYRVVYWGFGEIDREKSTYRIELTSPPPDTALLYGAFTAAYICLINDPGINEGEVSREYERDLIKGAVEDYMLVYVANPDHPIMKQMWLPKFAGGYNLGEGVRNTDDAEGGMDALKNVYPDKSTAMTVAPFGNLDMLNWF
jgi:hypothetical protein